MAWAVPGLLSAVPCDIAAQMRADCRDDMKRTGFIPADRDLAVGSREDAAVAGLQRIDRTALDIEVSQAILGQVRRKRRVLGDVVDRRSDRLDARGGIQFGVGVR